MKFPNWKVEGRIFWDAGQARAFANRVAIERSEREIEGIEGLDFVHAIYGTHVVIMQKDDALLPPFVLERIEVKR